MKKTVNINLAGLVFHIDEDAYEQLNNYLKAVRQSIGGDESVHEIMNDIEARIAELFSETIKPAVGVVTIQEVNRVIQIMGQPTDYQWAENHQSTESTDSTTSQTHSEPKKLYRDEDDKVIGGVLSGLGHYFGIDAIWLRIAFAILLFYFGTGFLLYILLWIIMPSAKTTAEKLEMKREPVTVENIKNTVEAGIANAKNYGNKYGSSAANLIKKILGIGVLMFSMLLIISALLTPLLVSQANHIYVNDNQLMEVIYTNLPKWTVLTSLFFIIFCPACLFLILGLKILYNNIKYVRWFIFFILTIWVLAIAFFSYAIIKTETEGDMILNNMFQENYNTITYTYDLNVDNNDTLLIDFITDPKISYINAGIEENDEQYIENRNVKLSILESKNEKAYYEIETKVFSSSEAEIKFKGKSKTVHIRDIPETLDYFHETTENKLILANALLETDVDDDFIENQVRVTLYVPEGLTIHLDSKYIQHLSDKKHIEKGAHFYQQTNQQLKCTNC